MRLQTFCCILAFYSIFILWPIKKVIAQQTRPNLINLNLIGYNPAITGSRNKVEILLLNHQDFQVQNSLVQASVFLPKIKSGVGLLVESYQSFLQTQTSFNLNLAYRVELKNGLLQFGLAPVLQNSRVNGDNLKIRNPEDASASIQTQNLWNLNYNGGAMFKSEKLLISLSGQNIMSNSTLKQSANLTAAPQRLLAAYTSYQIPFGEHWKFIPSVYYQNWQTTSFAAIANQIKYRYLFLGFQYGMYNSWTGSIGVTETELGKLGSLYLGYSLSSRDLGISKTLVHEIYVNLGFGLFHSSKGKIESIPQYRSPVYF